MGRPVEELIRLAMVYAEQDRRSFAEANGSNQVAAEANELADAFRAYRMKRWGRTTMEAQLDSATLVPIDELRRRASLETRHALSPKGNPCLHHPDGCLRAADNSECWPCDHAGRSPAYVGSLCEHVPKGFACEICNHDGVQR